ncbi:Laccase-21 [Capsicum baccatum]|uniref:Laccase n=1 Tax=Capsicum baccatum TaxID=33114 RepID=A0A2G2WZF5_CAPBA|nr:Laccase-21 [Capsicum baccatum]
MKLKVMLSIQHIIGYLFLVGLLPAHAAVHQHRFVIKEAPHSKLCSSKNILTVNGQFPGPVLYANTGDTLVVNVQNDGSQNITIHWHGVKQPRYPWSDGPEFVTQCPIRPGTNFSQEISLSDEEGTLWWHAHSDWSRATVHGALVIRPANKTNYPFPTPAGEVPLILGEWWKSDVQAIVNEFVASGGDANNSDAFLINGQPGDLYPCSRNDTFKLTVEKGKTYMLRMVNAVMNNIMFFSIANHQLTIVGTDGAYVKPFKTNYIAISPGQTMDVLLEANQNLDNYYMAARAYNSLNGIAFDNTTTTAIIQYRGNYTPSALILPNLPNFNDTNASFNFTRTFKSLANKQHPVDVPLNITTNLLFTFSMNTLPCQNESCGGPNGDRFAASVNNISFVLPRIDILGAYYKNVKGVYRDEFPSFPPFNFNFTGDSLPVELQRPDQRTQVHVLEYGTNVEIVLQGTSLLGGIDHPIHLHGYSFYVVGSGLGNFDRDKDPLNYNLVDPPLQNTIAIVRNGWATIRFKADNPGVWFMHCHFDRHVNWGMEMAFIVKDGTGSQQKLLPPPPDMPKC